MRGEVRTERSCGRGVTNAQIRTSLDCVTSAYKGFELVFCHRDRLKAWKPDDALTRKLATLNQERRKAVDQRTQLANGLKSQLETLLSFGLAGARQRHFQRPGGPDLLLQWPSLEALQKVSPPKLRKCFYGHNCRQEHKLLERLRLIKEAKPLVRDPAVIEPAVLRLQMLAQQLKTLLPYIARYKKQIAELFRLPSR